MHRAELRDQVISLYRGRHYIDAAEAALRYLENAPEDEIVLEILADSAVQAGHIDVGERTITLLLDRKRTPTRLSCLATIRSAQGEMKVAEGLMREALAIDPTMPGIWGLIAGVHRFRKDDPLIVKAKRILKRKDVPADARRSICFALCKAMNDIGKWDRAWDYAAQGAALANSQYDPGEFDRWLDDINETFDAEFLARKAGRGSESEAPVFIVGMPRSGTTLMEIVLAATGEIAPMGERTIIPDITARAVRDDAARGNTPSSHAWVRRWRDDAFGQVADFYLQDIARRTGGSVPTRFTDKLPGNVLYLGEIGLIFPRAKIIRMHRDPLDTCVSCYLGQFHDGHDYTYRTDWLARAAHGFQQIGDALAPIIPNDVLDVHYENLVSNPEPEIRRVLQFLDVTWTADCLTPAPVGYTTTTRSVAQIRKPINSSSVGRWRRYANRIGPLADALGIDLTDAA
ncbi:MAG: sulfotransferase [Pseudomonadota bacterium]